MSYIIKKIILLSLLFIPSLHAQEPLEYLKEGSLILAKQFHDEGQKLKAVTLLTFCLELDESNQEAQKFISIIDSQEEVRLYQRLPDKGRNFSKFINKIVQNNTDLPGGRIKHMAYIAKVLDPNSPTAHISDEENYFDTFKKYFPDYSPETSEKTAMLGSTVDHELIRKLVGKKPFEIAKSVTVHKLTHNPRNLLYTINELNKLLHPFKTSIQIQTNAIPVQEEAIVHGVKKYIGEELDVRSITVSFNEATIYEILKYIEHTLALTFLQDSSQIVIREGVRGKNGRPELFKLGSKLVPDIKQSTIKAKAKYHMKSIQIKGNITQLKAESSKLLVEIDNHFVAEIDNRLLKASTIQLMKDYLQKQKMEPSSAEQMLNVSLRGFIKIRTISRTDIIKCTSIIAEDAPHFYLKH